MAESCRFLTWDTSSFHQWGPFELFELQYTERYMRQSDISHLICDVTKTIPSVISIRPWHPFRMARTMPRQRASAMRPRVKRPRRRVARSTTYPARAGAASFVPFATCGARREFGRRLDWSKDVYFVQAFDLVFGIYVWFAPLPL